MMKKACLLVILHCAITILHTQVNTKLKFVNADNPVAVTDAQDYTDSTYVREESPNSVFLDCNNWLRVGTQPSYARVGDLDIPGNQITVEAVINRTTPWVGDYFYAGDVVSKHKDPVDVNYLLRPNSAQITTTDNGHVFTRPVCDIELNKTYHIAMVYNGSSLKFYRNGFLMDEVPCSGNMIQNDWKTQIGYYEAELHPTGFIGYINEVRIWNVARTQQQLRDYMSVSLPNPTTQAGLQAYYTFDNLLNKQGNTTWNATLTGNATINQLNPTCVAFTPDSCGIRVENECKFDFTYKQDPCNPLTVQFFAEGENPVNAYWLLGDGSPVSGNTTPSHTYPAFGDYVVKFTARTNNTTCTDTITKTIAVKVQKSDIILTPDTTICYGATKQLRTKPALDFCWSPTTYLDDPNSPNPITSTPRDITYYYNAQVLGNNLIVNGDFSAGNAGFTSEYAFIGTNTTEGEYFVGTNPTTWNPNLSTCGDHTAGNGNMMLVNGSPVVDVNVWKQTVTVTPNTNYAFVTWIQALWPPNPAQLQFSINGQTVGDLITAIVPTCTWSQFYTTWNSGNNTTATIAIVNKNTAIQGNDFALDDISFSPVIIQRDSVIIKVDTPALQVNNDTTICMGKPVPFTVTGASTYTWSPAEGLSTTTGSNPIAAPITTTKYMVTGITADGCQAKDSVLVTVYTKPIITISNDIEICPGATTPLMVSGGVSWLWSPAASLSNAAIANPIASPAASTLYKVQVTDANNCTYPDSVLVSIKPRPAFSISPNQPVCIESAIIITASGGINYQWSPAATLSDPNIASPVATPTVTTTYTVYASEPVCNFDSTMSVTITVNPKPVVHAQKSNDIDCTSPTSILTATGASAYLWSPAQYLDDPRKYNPLAGIDSTTMFHVTGTNQFGCSSEDSVQVTVNKFNQPIYALPNAFTPNGDTKNECFGLKKWGSIQLLEFSIYNRWGQKVFSTTNPADCWDGTYKGKYLDIGGYAYVIRAKTFCGDVKRTGVVLLLR